MKDQHPVTWLLKNLKTDLYAPLCQWMSDAMENALPPVDSVTMPDPPLSSKTQSVGNDCH